MTTTKEAAKASQSLDPTPKSLSPSSDVMTNLVQQVKTMQAAPPSLSGCGTCSTSSCGTCGSGSDIWLPPETEARLPRSNVTSGTKLPSALPPNQAQGGLIYPPPLSSHYNIASNLDDLPSMDSLSMPSSGGCGSGSCGCGSGKSESQPTSSLVQAQGIHEPGDDTNLGDLTEWIPPPPNATAEQLAQLSRREFVRQLLVGAIAGVGLVTNMGCKPDQRAELTQQHYYRLSPNERRNVVARLERVYWTKYRRRTKVSTTAPLRNVMFGFALDLSLCTGCRKCVYACVEENNQSRDPQIHWIRVLQLESEKGLDMEAGTAYYNPDTVPQPGKTYMPVACQQCANSPCTKICPVQATWRDPDGIVVVDYNWCIGCRYCMVACPYEARMFNWGTPSIPSQKLNPDMHYLGNRPRPRGVVEKCTFCIQRVRKGRYPACVEACPVGARKFGNLNDPNGELQKILKRKKILVLKEELNTKPQFFYYY